MWLHFVHHLTLHFEARTAETENDGPKKASAEIENDGPKKASAFPSEPRIKVSPFLSGKRPSAKNVAQELAPSRPMPCKAQPE